MMTWNMATIGAVCSTYSGGTPSTANSEYYDGNIPWIASAELNQGRITSTRSHISKLGLERSAAKMVESGTPLIALYGATAGVPAITDIGGAINQAVLAMVPRGVDAEFLYQWLRANRDEIIDRYTQGGQPNLSGAIVRSIEIPLPSIPEQKRISGALRDADDLIATLERLIAKKQAIKQGMMQQLLTGRTRSSGLKRAWSTARLGDVASVVRGASPRPIASPRWFSDSSEVGWVRISDLARSNGSILHTTTQRLSPDGIARSRYLPSGTLIMSIAATVGVPIITGFPTCIHDGFVAIQTLRGVDPIYLLYVLKCKQDELRSAGQTGSQANVNTEIVKNLRLPIPPIEEQHKIAVALRDIDAEIEVLGLRSKKAQDIKTGMMQQLLTGRTRLPVETAS